MHFGLLQLAQISDSITRWEMILGVLSVLGIVGIVLFAILHKE